MNLFIKAFSLIYFLSSCFIHFSYHSWLTKVRSVSFPQFESNRVLVCNSKIVYLQRIFFNYFSIEIRLSTIKYKNTIYYQMSVSYSDNQKTVDYEDDIKAKLNCIWCCYKANTLTSVLLNHLLHEMGLFTLHNYCASCSLEYLKS